MNKEVKIKGWGLISPIFSVTGEKSTGVITEGSGKYVIFIEYNGTAYNPCNPIDRPVYEIEGKFIGIVSGYPTVGASNVTFLECFRIS